MFCHIPAKKYLWCAAALVVLGLSWPPYSGAQECTTSEIGLPSNRIVSLRSSQSKGKVRLVIETEQEPEYQVMQCGEKLCLEILNAAPNTVQPQRLGKSPYIASWKASQPSLGTFCWEINCRYPLPPEQCRFSVLNNPPRLVADLYTEWVEDERYQLTPGVSWQRRQYFGHGFPYLLWNCVNLDPADPHIKLDVGLGQDSARKCEAVSSMVARKNALLGMNGGYFNVCGGNLCLVVRDSKIISPQVSRRPPRSAFGLTNDKRPLFGRAKVVNRQVQTLEGQTWKNLELAIGGGPRLLRNKQVKLTTDAEQLGPKGNDITRSCGRTAIGVDAQGHLTLATASGYSDSHSQGARLEQMAQMMLEAGAVEAVNLDGGGSVDMSIQGKLAAHGPREGTYERPVGNALLVYDDRPTTHPDHIDIETSLASAVGDGLTRIEVTAKVKDSTGYPVADGTPVTFNAPGLLSSRALTTGGRATALLQVPRHTGCLTVTAKSGLATQNTQVEVCADAPVQMWGKWYRRVLPPLTSSPACTTDAGMNKMLNELANFTAELNSRTYGTDSGAVLPTSVDVTNTSSAHTDNSADSRPAMRNNSNYRALPSPSAGTTDRQDLPTAPTDNAEHEPVPASPNPETPQVVTEPQAVQVVDMRLRLVDKWHNGVAKQNVEVWTNGQHIATYTSDAQGEVRQTLQLPVSVRQVIFKTAGLPDGVMNI